MPERQIKINRYTNDKTFLRTNAKLLSSASLHNFVGYFCFMNY